jgi:hypothetical protein
MNADPSRGADPIPYATPAPGARIPIWVWLIVGCVGAALVLAMMLFSVRSVTSSSAPATVSAPTTSAATPTGGR